MDKPMAIREFLKKENIAVFGVSRDSKKFGNFAYKELKKKGQKVYGVNPKLNDVDGDDVYPQLNAIPHPIDAALISVSPEKAKDITKELIESGIKNIWFQQGSSNNDIESYCRENGIEPITGECILMYKEPVESYHGFHRWLWNVFGRLRA